MWWGGWAGQITPAQPHTWPGWEGVSCIPHPLPASPILTLHLPSSPHIPHPHPVSAILTPHPSRWWQVSRALTVRLTLMNATPTRATTGPARTALPPSPACASPATQATAATSTSTSARASPAKTGAPARTGTTPTTASASKGPRVSRGTPGALYGSVVPVQHPCPIHRWVGSGASLVRVSSQSGVQDLLPIWELVMAKALCHGAVAPISAGGLRFASSVGLGNP